MVIYSFDVRRKWSLAEQQTSSNSALRTAILGVEYLDSWTNTPGGLEDAIDMLENTPGNR